MAQDLYKINEVSSLNEEQSIKHEIEQAKLYLQTHCSEAGDNFYDHLSEVLSKVLMERPQNIFQAFDEYSRKLQNNKFSIVNDTNLCNQYIPSLASKEAKKVLKLIQDNLLANEDHESKEEDAESIIQPKTELPNMFDLLHFFEPADIGLPRAEMVILNLSIRKLIAEKKLNDVRFWGKILGRPKNYYIVEASFTAEELEQRLEELREREESLKKDSEEADSKAVEEEDLERKAIETALLTKSSFEDKVKDQCHPLIFNFPPLPVNTWKPIPEVSQEQLGTGTNAKVYYVCNSPGIDNWIELPSVTPQQIVVARQIVHLCTGDLDAEIHTFPPFPGSEKNYLRAQIARIGATTHVSPIGYFKFGKDTVGEGEEEDDENEDDEEEENEGKGYRKIVKNRHYNPLPISDLVDPSMSNWCHHCPHILKQGRVIWQDPRKSKSENEDEEVEEEEEEEEDDDEGSNKGSSRESENESAFVKEIGPPLLTPLSEDPVTEFTTPWTARVSSKIQPDTAVALIRSNIWPGASAVAVDNKFANLYIGWGHKYNAYNYNPPSMPEVQDQYGVDNELKHMQDPTLEEEEAYRIAHLPPAPEGEDEEEDDVDDDLPTEVDSIQNDDEDCNLGIN